MARKTPHVIQARPAYGYEQELGATFVVNVSGSGVHIELPYPGHYNRAKAIEECVGLWHACREVGGR